MTIPMIATKGLRYAGRRIEAGTEFDAKSRMDARTLAAIGKASYRTAAFADSPVQKPMLADVAATSAATAETSVGGPQDDGSAADIAALRSEYETVIGKRPFMGWDAATLRAKIDAHEPDAE